MNINPNIQNFFEGVGKQGRKFLDTANYLVTNTDPLSKISKLISSILNFVGEVLSVFVPGAGAVVSLFSKIKTLPDAFYTFASATGIVSTINMFTDPAILEKLKKSWLKVVNRVTLAAGQVLETVNFLNSMAMINAGGLTSIKTGNLSILNGLKNGFMAISATFGICDSAKTIQNAGTNMGNKSFRSAKRKLQAWTNKNDAELQQHLNDNAAKYNNIATAEGLKDYKIQKYSNYCNTLKKARVAIVAEVTKLAIIALASVTMVLVLTGPVVALGLAGCGLLAATCGLVKTLYDRVGPQLRPIPVNPHVNEDYVPFA